MPHCQNCGGFVTPDFKRVFSGRDGEVHGCFECMDHAEIKQGAATKV